MFTRIMAVVMTAIILTTVCLSVVGWLTLRDQQINARLDYLIAQAGDIAYLAAGNTGSALDSFLGNSTGRLYLNRKAKQVNDEFGAYIAVVDRWGSVMDNLQTAYSEDPDFVASLSGAEINEALRRILSGETIRLQSRSGENPTFTVGVPFTRNGYVTGAVFIQTKAQRIESGLSALLLRVGLIAAAVILVSGVAVFFLVRSVLKPLRSMTEATGAMAEGDFSVRLDETKGHRELREVNRAFNTMAQKLQGVEESRREFVANVSHELRSPITSIRGFAEGMADGVIPAEEQPKYLRLVADESKRLSGLVGELLELSRLERDGAEPDWSVFDINEMLRRAVIRRMNDLEEKNIEASCECDPDPCWVRADSSRIEEVVINLLDNAVKFTGEGGEIVLSSSVSGGTAEITVRDNGIGIPKEDRDKIFDRFFTADRAHTSGKGTGLGLSICKRVLEMHHQSIRLLDTETGAAFRFTLEAAEAPAKEMPVKETPAKETPGNGGTDA